jgi:hypothetical protein
MLKAFKKSPHTVTLDIIREEYLSEGLPEWGSCRICNIDDKK